MRHKLIAMTVLFCSLALPIGAGYNLGQVDWLTSISDVPDPIAARMLRGEMLCDVTPRLTRCTRISQRPMLNPKPRPKIRIYEPQILRNSVYAACNTKDCTTECGDWCRDNGQGSRLESNYHLSLGGDGICYCKCSTEYTVLIEEAECAIDVFR